MNALPCALPNIRAGTEPKSPPCRFGDGQKRMHRALSSQPIYSTYTMPPIARSVVGTNILPVYFLIVCPDQFFSPIEGAQMQLW
jgi:hypothetical protein